MRVTMQARPTERPRRAAGASRLCGPWRLLGVLAVTATLAGAQAPPVQTVASLDLARYAGKWYEIAAYPMFFQRNCVGDTTAEYALRADGEIAVRNRCRTEDGFDEANGTAWPVAGGPSSRLKVSFFWPFRSDYWVIGLDEDYRWAVVGNPERKYLWLLAREPRLDEAQLGRALRAAEAQGYDVTRLRYTRQGAAPLAR